MLWAIDSCQNKVSAGQYHLTLSRAQVSTRPGRVFFLKLSADKLLAFKWSKALFKFIWNMLCLYHQGPALLTFWFQTDLGPENSIKMQAGKMLFTFLTIVTRWSRFTSNFCSITGQNLTGEFIRKIYAASCDLFTLTAVADNVLCQLVMFLTVSFHWMYKMKFSCYQESSVIHGWFIYWIFGWEMRHLSKSETRFRMASFLFFTLLDA